MKSAKSSTRNVRRRDGKSSIRHSAKVRHRGVSLSLESLEPRTLLSVSSATNPASLISTTPTTLIPVSSTTENLPSGLSVAVKDANTIATVVAPSATGESVAAAATSHIYTGQPTNFGQAATANPVPSSGTPAGGAGQYSASPDRRLDRPRGHDEGRAGVPGDADDRLDQHKRGLARRF